MRCDVLAIGTELLLGQIVDTNSAWIGEQLAEAGIDTYDHRKIGDNLPRMVDSLRELLEEADAVIVCGGLGPTPDDVTREAIAEVMGVQLERREELIEQIRAMFGSRAREMTDNNLRQADVPVGGSAIPNPIGTAPGVQGEFIAPDGSTRVIYAVPGVPYEMQKMVTEHVIPDLLARSGERAVIRSRSLKTWGTSESALAEMIADRVDTQSNPTIAFLARGIEGLYVRMTAKAPTEDEARALLDAEDADLRTILGELIFGIDNETMESAVLDACRARVDARRRGVAHRWAHRRATHQRGRRVGGVPRLDRVVRDRRRSATCSASPRNSSFRRSAQSRWPRAHAACSAPTSASASPASPGRPSKTGSRRALSSTRSRCRATRPKWCRRDCRSTASAFASSPPSRC